MKQMMAFTALFMTFSVLVGGCASADGYPSGPEAQASAVVCTGRTGDKAGFPGKAAGVPDSPLLLTCGGGARIGSPASCFSAASCRTPHFDAQEASFPADGRNGRGDSCYLPAPALPYAECRGGLFARQPAGP